MRPPGRLLKTVQNPELPLAALNALTELREHLASLELQHVHNARQKGASWEDIAQALAISRQAVQQRFANGTSGRTNGASRHPSGRTNGASRHTKET